MKRNLGMLGLLAATIIWGGGFVASDLALGSLSPSQILTVRFAMGAVLMLPMCVGQLKQVPKEEIRAGILLGVLLFGGFAFQLVGLSFTTPSKNAFLTATNVVLVPFIAMILYKKKVSPQAVMGAVMAIGGAGVLSLERGFAMGLGDGLTLVCAVCFAFQIFFTGQFVSRYRAGVLNFYQMATACFLSFVYLMIKGEAGAFAPSQTGIASVIYLGVASTALTYLLQTVSQKYVDETRTAIILSLEAVFGSVFSVILLKEMVSTKMILGSILILGAVLVSEIRIPIPTCNFRQKKL